MWIPMVFPMGFPDEIRPKNLKQNISCISREL